jgi:hypothetical protein
MIYTLYPSVLILKQISLPAVKTIFLYRFRFVPVLLAE